MFPTISKYKQHAQLVYVTYCVHFYSASFRPCLDLISLACLTVFACQWWCMNRPYITQMPTCIQETNSRSTPQPPMSTQIFYTPPPSASERHCREASQMAADTCDPSLCSQPWRHALYRAIPTMEFDITNSFLIAPHQSCQSVSSAFLGSPNVQ